MTEIITTMYLCFAVGIGLTVYGFLSTISFSWGIIARITSLVLGFITSGAVISLTLPEYILATVYLGLGATSLAVITAFPQVRQLLSALCGGVVKTLAAMTRPRVRTVLVGCSGIVLIVGGFVYYDHAMDRQVQNDLEFLQQVEFANLSLTDARTVLKTDKGKNVLLKTTNAEIVQDLGVMEKRWLETSPHRDKLIHRESANTQSNCHGWVFTHGKFIVPGSEVDAILHDNGYYPVQHAEPNDVVVYRAQDGSVLHTAIVRAKLDDGTLLVEGKWGFLGVYLHDVRTSCYGDNFTFHRTDRSTHYLQGMETIEAE